MKNICKTLSISSKQVDSEHFYTNRNQLSGFFKGKKQFLMERFYREIGDTLKNNYPNTNAWFITANLEALKFVGLRPSRKIKLFNGSLEARLVKYEMYEGSKKGKYMNSEE